MFGIKQSGQISFPRLALRRTGDKGHRLTKEGALPSTWMVPALGRQKLMGKAEAVLRLGVTLIARRPQP